MGGSQKEPSVERAMEDGGCCLQCLYREPLHGSDTVVSICSHRSGYRGLWVAVGPDDCCAHFRARMDFNSVGTAHPTQSGVRTVPLTQGKFALVDVGDYAAVMKYHWYAAKKGGRAAAANSNTPSSNPLPPSGDSPLAGGEPPYVTWYAERKERGRTVRMHRVILGAGPGQLVDHINHDGLDNRRCNLRVCSNAENVRNQRAQRGRSSRYKGVSRDGRPGRWRALIWFDGRRHNLGLFESEIAAARAYNAKAREVFGAFAYLNDVE